MHKEAFEFVEQFASNRELSVIEIGSRNINGSVRSLFPNATWVGLDLHDGPDVDWVGDSRNFEPQVKVDMVVCCESIEHAEGWYDMLRVAAKWVKPNGQMIITCAGPGRAPHSHIDGCQLRLGEHYNNISAVDVKRCLTDAGMDVLICRKHGDDTQAIAVRPLEYTS
jgi:hypothetical protein